jgi:hypothetical protein
VTGARRVLVLQSGARPGPWTCRSLTRVGHVVIAAHDGRSGGLTGGSRWTPRPLRSPSPEDDPPGYLRWLEAVVEGTRTEVVLPVTEGVTHLLAARFDGRVGPAVISGPGRDVYRALCEKDGLQASALACGVGTPRGTAVIEGRDHGPLPPAPCVVKPLSSATPRPGGVVYRPAAIVADDAGRDSEVRETVAATGGALVQELAHGPRWRVHFARGAGSFAAVAWRTVRSSPRSAGMSSVSRLTPIPPPLGAAAARLVAAAGYHGVGSLQFIETPEGFLVHDANLRLVFSVGATIGAGLDLPALAVAIATGGEIDLASLRVRPTRYVWLAGELRAGLGEVRAARPWAAARASLDLVGAAVLPGRVLDPSDPVATADLLAAAIRRRRSSADDRAS